MGHPKGDEGVGLLGEPALGAAVPARTPGWLRAWARGIAGASVLLLSFWAFAQTAEERLSFEVASVKPAAPPVPGSGTRSRPDGIEFFSATLRYCIVYAYRLQDYQVSAPSWMADLHYDIVAKMPKSGRYQEMPEMLQTLLAERFKLKVHAEQKDFPGYALVVGPGGPKLSKPADGDTGKIVAKLGDIPPQPLLLHEHLPTGGQRVMGVQAGMGYLVRDLSLNLGCPVVDLTNLPGTYDFVLEMSREDMRNGLNAMVGGPAGEDPGVSIFSSVQGLGLRLKPHKSTLDVIVVDHAERVPTENGTGANEYERQVSAAPSASSKEQVGRVGARAQPRRKTRAAALTSRARFGGRGAGPRAGGLPAAIRRAANPEEHPLQ